MEGIRSDESLKGIIPRSFDHIFSFIAQCPNPNVKWLVQCSYAEI